MERYDLTQDETGVSNLSKPTALGFWDPYRKVLKYSVFLLLYSADCIRCTLENRKVHPWINVRALELALFGTLPTTRKLCGRILNRDAHLWDRGSVQPSPGWLQDIQGLPAQVRFGLSRASSLMNPHAICYNLRVTA